MPPVTKELSKKQQGILDRIAKAMEREEAAHDKVVDAVAKARDEEITWRAIADAMDIPLSTVHTKYAREIED